MDTTLLNTYFMNYGLLFLFIIVLLEYMNLPGFPSGVIMPLGGIWLQSTGMNFWYGVLITVLAGLIGSWILYFVGRFGGHYLVNKYTSKFPKQGKLIQRTLDIMENQGNFGIFISKLMPVMRTIVGIPAGVIRFSFLRYTIFSTLGIFIWNFLFMASGYFFSVAFI